MAVPARHRSLVQSPRNKCFSPEERSQAVRELCNRRGTARKVAQSIGVSVPVLYKWKKDLISDEAYQSMRDTQRSWWPLPVAGLARAYQHLRTYKVHVAQRMLVG
ncbi:transposase [Klebsiella pneumoniae]|uniref:transposase n=1 Tax=Klebsiella pneumoniae TaxID=573 RepID=UPI0015C66524|nr:transposase [Klebsiella pneumoniae]